MNSLAERSDCSKLRFPAIDEVMKNVREAAAMLAGLACRMGMAINLAFAHFARIKDVTGVTNCKIIFSETGTKEPLGRCEQRLNPPFSFEDIALPEGLKPTIQLVIDRHV
jgi:hypothetical protein